MAERKAGEPVLTAQAMVSGLRIVPPSATLQEAAVMLGEAGVALLAVGEGDRVAGSVSIWDLALKGCAAGFDPASTPVSQVMTVEPVLCRVEMPAAESLELMRRRGMAAMLVHDRNDRVVGVLSLHRLLDLLDSHEPHGPEPESVRRVRGDTF